MFRSLARSLCLASTTLMLASGCSMMCKMDPPKKAAVPPEMQKLAKFVGKWSGTAELTYPTKECMMKNMPPGAPAPQTSFKGGNECRLDLGGMRLVCDGWYEMGEGQKVNYSESWMWCGKSKKYHMIMMDDWGNGGYGTARWTGDNSMKMKGMGYSSDGTKKSHSGTISFADANTITWSFEEKCAWGLCKCMGMTGTSKKQ